MNEASRSSFRDGAFAGIVGIGGIGTGSLIELEGGHTLGRTESRLGRLLDARDYCKLHIVEHYLAVLLKRVTGESSCRVIAVGNVGRDDAGARLLREMALAGIDTRYVRVEAELKTLFSLSFLYPDRSGGNITISNSAAAALSLAQLEGCRAELDGLGPRAIALCLPEVPLAVRGQFLRIGTECRSFRVASFAAGEMAEVRRQDLLASVDLLALNREEAAALGGGADAQGETEEILQRCLEIASAMNPAIRLVITSGRDGVDVFNGTWSHYPALPVDVVSSAGAGDALLAGVIAGLIMDLPLVQEEQQRKGCSAIELGLLVAAFSLTSPHTIHPEFTVNALREFASARHIPFAAGLFSSTFGAGVSATKQTAGTSR